jgi:hypothetical protein
VRLRLAISGTIIEVVPIDDDYIALNNANYPFVIDREVKVKDKILVDIINYDSTNAHKISVIVTWSSDRVVK